MLRTNWCLRSFQYTFSSILSGIFAGLLCGLFKINPENLSTLQLLLGLAVLMSVSWAIGNKVYARRVRPLLLARGWNEYSFWRGMELDAIMIILFFGILFLLIGLSLFFTPAG